MRRSTVITLLLLITILSVVALFVWQTQQKAAEQAKSDSPAGVAFGDEGNTFTSLRGEPVALDSFDELTVAYVWASWCPQCQSEIEALSEIATTYQDGNLPVRVVAINRREPAATAERYLNQVDYSDALIMVLDTTDSFYSSIEAYAMPELVLFDIDGNEILRQRGAIDFSAVEVAVDRALTELAE